MCLMYIYLDIYTKKQVKNSLIYWIITCYHGIAFNKICSIENMWVYRLSVRYRDSMYLGSASHALSKIQYVLVSNLGTYLWCFEKKKFSGSMVRRLISEEQRCQIIGKRSTGISFKAIGRQTGYHYAIVIWPLSKHTQTNTVKYFSKYGRQCYS